MVLKPVAHTNRPHVPVRISGYARVVLLVVIAALIAAYFLLDLGRFFSLDYLNSIRADADAAIAAQPVRWSAIFFGAYVAVAAIFFQHFAGAIGAAVVDQDQLASDAAGADTTDHFIDRADLVENRHDDRQQKAVAERIDAEPPSLARCVCAIRRGRHIGHEDARS